MRTRRFTHRTDAEAALSAASPRLEAIGYRREGERLRRRGLLLTETVAVEDGRLTYRYVTSHVTWGALLVAITVTTLGLTAWVAPRGVAWLADAGLGPHPLLTAVTYGAAFVVCYSPFTWAYAALSAPGFERERATIDAILRS